MKKHLTGSFLIVILMCALSLNYGSIAATNQIPDTLSLNVSGLGLLQHGPNGYLESYRFSYYLSANGAWSLKLDPESDRSWEYSVEYPGEEVRTLVKRINPDGSARYHANLYPGPQPIQLLQPLIPTIWLSFDPSARKLYESDELTTCPFSSTGEIRELKVFSSSNSEEIALEFFDNGIDFQKGNRRKPPFHEGFKKFEVRSQDFVNTNGWSIPKFSQYTEYVPRSGARSANEVVMTKECKLYVTNIAFVKRPEGILPPPGASISVGDVRLENYKKAINYYFTNNWPTIGEMKETPEYEDWKINNPRYAKSPNRKRLIRVLALCSFFILTLLFVRSYLKKEPFK